MSRYFILHKPYGYLSQFTHEGGHKSLADLHHFPKDVYPVGRLDTDSEGLLILTSDKTVNSRLLHPKNKHHRTYWAQLEGMIGKEALYELQHPLMLNIKGKPFRTAGARVSEIMPDVEERDPPIRYRKNIPTSWIEISITEGKNRQVRKMCAAVGYPVLRLIRVAIEQLQLDIGIGQVKEVSRDELFRKLNL